MRTSLAAKGHIYFAKLLKNLFFCANVL